MMRFLRTVLVVVLCLLQQNAFATNNVNEVLILMGNTDLPVDGKLVGTIKASGGFKAEYSYERAMAAARNKALDKGGNLVCITKLQNPGGISGYRLNAEVYYVADLEAYKERKRKEMDSTLHAMLPANAPYALLYVYRPRNSKGSLVAYNIHVNDDKACRMTNYSKHALLLYPGRANIWTRTEARAEVDIEVQAGKVYFLRCGVEMGLFVGRPEINLVSEYRGLEECKRIDTNEP